VPKESTGRFAVGSVPLRRCGQRLKGKGGLTDDHEETLRVIKKAWTEDAWEYNGEYYKVPYPYEEGIRRWPVAEWTRTYGAPGEVVV
jgi:hypothetical protein